MFNLVIRRFHPRFIGLFKPKFLSTLPEDYDDIRPTPSTYFTEDELAIKEAGFVVVKNAV